MADDGGTVTDANWELRRQSGASWVVVATGRGTGRKGVEQFCWPTLVGDMVQVRVWRDGQAPATASYEITRRSTLLRVELPRP